MAEYYASVIDLLDRPEAPARMSHLAHALRELANHLPDVMGVQRRTRVELKDAAAEVARLWVDADLPLEPADVEPRSDATSDTAALDAESSPTRPQPLELPAELASAVIELVRVQSAGDQTAYARAALMITGQDDSAAYARGGGHPKVRRWRRIVRDLFPYVHAADSRRPDPDEEQLRSLFEEFEDILYSVIRPALEHVDDLDELLAEVNATGDEREPETERGHDES